MARLFRLLVLAASLSTACAGEDGAEAIGETSEALADVQATALFNLPTAAAGYRSAILFDELGKLVDVTPKGESIRVSVYTVGANNAVVDKLVAARARGVDVKVVVDRESYAAPDGVVRARLRGVFGTDPKAASFIRACGADADGSFVRARSGCNGEGDKANNHNKFVLFSRSGGDRFVTWVGSTNFTSSQARTWNNALVLRNDEASYKRFVRVFDTFVENIADPRTPARPQLGAVMGGTSGNVEVAFTPDARGQDYLERFVGSIACDRARGHAIRISMHEFSNSRIELARALARTGCRVDMVGSLVGWKVREVFGSSGALHLDRLADFDPAGEHMDHDKYVVVHADLTSGKVGKKACTAASPCRDVKMVLTGSHNWSDRGMSINDESIVRIVGATQVFDAYAQNFETLRSEAKEDRVRFLPKEDEWAWCTSNAQCASGACDREVDGAPQEMRFCK